MLHQSLKSLLSFNLIKAYLIVGLLLINSSFASFFSSYKRNISEKKENFTELVKKMSYIDTKELDNYQSLYFHKSFIDHVLFYTPAKYITLAKKDKCSFYDLILSGALRDHKGVVSDFIVQITTKDKSNITGLIKRENFIQKILEKECPSSLKFAQYFEVKNLPKTLKRFKLPIPKSLNQCQKIHKDLLNDHKTPYYCYLENEIKKIQTIDNMIKLTNKNDYIKLTKLKEKRKKANKIKGFFSKNSIEYIENLCENIEKPTRFCQYFFDDSFYKKIGKRIASPVYVQNHCKELFKKYNKATLKTCLSQLSRFPLTCHFLNKYDHALVPKPSCEQLSKTLNLTRLKTRYTDCPGKVANETVINISRLLKHFSKNEIESDSSDCKNSSLETYAQYIINHFGKESWGTKVCYKNEATEKEVCTPTVKGYSKTKSLSLDQNIKKILTKIKKMSSQSNCEIVSRQDYNPVLLKYKSGCFIIRNPRSCKSSKCNPKIIYDRSEVKEITIKENFSDEYFGSSFQSEPKSQVKNLIKYLNLKTKPILNTSFLKSHLRSKPSSILHGVGCIEFLYPTKFKLKSPGQCTPVAFLSDGIFESNGIFSLAIRSSIDALHAPRVVSWSDIFSSVKSYQSIHPLNTWSLNALYY